MSERAPYSRVYWSIIDDPKFLSVYDDDRHLATWLRLLLVADQSWPASAHLPAGCRRSSVAELERVGLVDLSGNRYRVHGLDAERGRRASAAKRDPVGTQLGGKREAAGSLDETRRDETSKDETPRDPADIYWQLTGKFPAGRALDWIDNMAAAYGAEPTIRAIVKAQQQKADVSDLLTRTQDVLRADARKLDLKEREAETQRLAEKRAAPRVEEPWKAEYREAIRRQYAEMDGAA